MKKTIAFLLLFTPTILMADMMQMMQQMQQLESCMTKVNQNTLDKLAKKGNKLHQETKDLCKAGKNSLAQKKLVGFAKEMNANPEFKKMRICVNKINLPMITKSLDDKFKIDTSQNICDSLTK